MSDVPEEVITQLDELLSHPKQLWFLGAGISKEAGVPLMYPLTERIQQGLEGDHETDFRAIRNRLRDGANVEHVLSQIGNLIGIAEHASDQAAPFGEGAKKTTEELTELHRAIQRQLREVIRWGYKGGSEEREEQVGTPDNPLVTIDDHERFVRSLFENRRAGLERRPPVALFTTNYDTLLEDALALNEVEATDGFSGGSMAFWSPQRAKDSFLDPFKRTGGLEAKLYKLHGSIDWYASAESVVVRRREGTRYPSTAGSRLLVYPQATKYQTTQEEPFAHLFRAFRRALNDSGEGVMAICGYGFGDKHINREIETSLSRPSNQMTLIAFAKEESTDDEEEGGGLPDTLARWLESSSSWTDRLVVVTDEGFYHREQVNQLPTDYSWDLWSFQGLIEFLEQGPEAVDDV